MALNVHKLILATAIEMAESLYEDWASANNKFYKQVRTKRARRLFVLRVSPKLYEDARKTLATMLGMDSTPEYMKREIHEALVLDNDLRANRMVAPEVATVPVALH